MGRAQPSYPSAGAGAGRRPRRSIQRTFRGASHRLRVRLRDLGPRRGRRHHRRSRPRPGLRPAAGRHHPLSAVQAGRPGRRRAAGVTINCGNSRFSLPTMPVEDYPQLPAMPQLAGTVAPTSSPRPSRRSPSRRAGTTRCRCSPASAWRSRARAHPGRHRPVPPRRPRAEWQPEDTEQSTAVLIPARTLAEVAKTLSGAGRVELALSAGDGMLGITGAGRRATTRLLDAEFPRFRQLHPGRAHHLGHRRGRRTDRVDQARRAGHRPRRAGPHGVRRRRAAAHRRRRRRGQRRGGAPVPARGRAAHDRVQPRLPARRAGRPARRAGQPRRSPPPTGLPSSGRCRLRPPRGPSSPPSRRRATSTC